MISDMTQGLRVRVNTGETVPVTVITGFLGSGKTTLLNQLLRAPDLSDTAVIINEFGEVGLDHLLIEQAIENAVLLKNGCICCTVRGDIADTLGELFRKRDSGELPWFSRIAIETTGLADPGPVVHSVLDAGLDLRLDGIVTTLDAQHAPMQLAEHPEARSQIAFADRILLTKADIATPAQCDAAVLAARRANVLSPIQRIGANGVIPEDVFGLGVDHPDIPLVDQESRHGDIVSVLVWPDAALRWDAVQDWLDSILSLRGADILRIKGVLRLQGHAAPVVLQAVHHVVHPLRILSDAASKALDEDESFLVVIGRGLPAGGLRASFRVAMGG
jgi:G3E family GTPase